MLTNEILPFEKFEKIEVKNKTNWLLALILPIPLLVLLLIIFVLLPLFSLKGSIILSILNYLYTAAIPAGFFMLFLYIWLWNTFGKTILEVSPNQIRVRTKNKLFSKSKTYFKSEIQKIGILDLSIERTRYHIRPNYLFSNTNQSVIITVNYFDIRIVDWLTIEAAQNMVKKIELTLNTNGTS